MTAWLPWTVISESDHFRRSLHGASEVLAPLRNDFRLWLVARRLQPALIADILLAAGQLLSNCIEHAGSRHSGTSPRRR